MTEGPYLGFPWPGSLVDGDLTLELAQCVPGESPRGRVPMLVFRMRRVSDGATMGRVDLRLSLTPALSEYGGHVAYRVEPEFQGHRYAARSVGLLKPLARAYGMDCLWITCAPDNAASRQTCLLAGGELVDIVPLPTWATGAEPGRRETCRYRVPLID